MINTIKDWSGVVAVLGVAWLIFASSFQGGTGAAGGRYMEQYIPVVRLNGGMATQLPFDMDGTAANLAVGGTLTTTGATALATTTTEALTVGGDRCTLTDANGGAFTLTQELLNRCSYFEFAAGGAGQEVIQLTMTATSSLVTFIPNAGDCKSFVYDSSALAAATTTTMTSAAGIIIIAPTVNDDLIDGLEYSDMKFCRRGNTDITWILSAELVDAD